MSEAQTENSTVPVNSLALAQFIRDELKLDISSEEMELKLAKAKRILALCAQIELDEDALHGAFLCAFTPLDSAQCERVQSQYGLAVSEIVKGVAQMDNISAFSASTNDTVSDENLRKMLIAMVNDVRVVLIKLAQQVDLLRSIKNEPEQLKRSIAQLTLDVYARLANRLGIWYLKWEMEDYSLRYLEPDDYHYVAKSLAEKRVVRENYIERFIQHIDQSLQGAELAAKIYGRPKHIYSIWRKMQSKSLSFENIHDIRAIRILVENVDQCYTALGLVHTNWHYLPGEFDDYIATPKSNGYQSIHTAVIGPDDKVVEVQIRTHAMHNENELGVAAHWRYKENTGKDQSIDNKIQWLRQLLEWKEDLGEDENLAKQFDAEVEETRIYVFTPKGRVIDLPQGSTAIDFAYAIHTEVGHRTRGTRINQKMRPLNTALNTGDQVEIITVKTGSPSRDWIALPGFIKTNRARNRISRWFKSEDRDQYLALGREKLERERARKRLHDLSFEKISNTARRYETVDDMMVALGAGEISATKLLTPFLKVKNKPVDTSPGTRSRAPKIERPESQFMVHGVGKLKTQIANCCQPMRGDEIIGYITRGRGISIHTRQCNNILSLGEDDLNRLIDVSWGHSENSRLTIHISILAYNRSNILHDVTNELKEDNVLIMKAGLSMQEDESVVLIHMNLEINDQQQLAHIINRVKNIPNVLEVKRLMS